MLKKSLSIIPLLVLSLSASAQEIGLDELIDEALQENYDIRIARIDQEVAENQNTWGNSGALPSLSLDGEATSSWIDSRQLFYNQDAQEASGAQNTSQSAGIALNWTVFDGFRMFARKDRFEALEELGRTNVRYFVEQSVADLATAYFQLIQERKLLKEMRSSLSISQERLELEEKRRGIGSGSELRVKEAQMDRNTDSSNVHQQKTLVEGLKVDINEMMGRDPRTPLIPEDPLELAEPLSREGLRDSAMANNADLERSRIEEMVSREELNEAEGMRWPEVDLFSQYNYDRSVSEVGFLESSQQRGPVIGARVRFNLYDGGQERIQRQNAQLEVQKQREEKERTQQTIDAAYARAYQNYSSALERVSLEKERVQNAREVMEIGRRRYETGQIDRIEFRNIQQGVLQAESALIRARFQAKREELTLLRLSGTLMERIHDGG